MPNLRRSSQLSLSHFADLCTNLRQISQIHAQMILTSRILNDTFAASRLLSFYSLNRHYHLALSLLFSLPSPNSFTFNTLIRAFSSSPFPSHSFLLFAHMLHSSIPPGKHTFPFLLKASSNLSSSSPTQQTHTHVLKHGLDEDLYVVNGLIHSYASCALVADARKVFDEMMGTKNSMIWTTMISGYAQNGMERMAIRLFERMVGEGVDPCGATLASVLSACARSGGVEVGRRVHGIVREKGVEVGVILGTALVDMYAKNGAIADAREVFDGMSERNTATWNAMICGSAHHGYYDGALELFREMERVAELGGLDVRPNDITFTGVLTACCRGGLVDMGREQFGAMQRKYGIELKLEHYGCMVDLLAKNGGLEEAEELARGMKMKADVVVWGALLTASRHYGKIEVAERVVEEMLKLDPQNHGVYVVLSNMYAEVGRWEDVERLRRVMADVGLKKIPGWSSVTRMGGQKTVSNYNTCKEEQYIENNKLSISRI